MVDGKPLQPVNQLQHVITTVSNVGFPIDQSSESWVEREMMQARAPAADALALYEKPSQGTWSQQKREAGKAEKKEQLKSNNSSAVSWHWSLWQRVSCFGHWFYTPRIPSSTHLHWRCRCRFASVDSRGAGTAGTAGTAPASTDSCASWWVTDSSGCSWWHPLLGLHMFTCWQSNLVALKIIIFNSS